MNKAEFISRCGDLLREAKPHLVRCEYRLGKDMPENAFEEYHANDEFALVTCENGYTYAINISCNSLIAIATAIFDAMAYK